MSASRCNWKKADGEAFGSLRALLADINQSGRAQMAMNGGIYAKSYAAGAVYRKGRAESSAESRFRRRQLFIRPGAAVLSAKANGRKSSGIDKFKPTPGIDYAAQSGPMPLKTAQ